VKNRYFISYATDRELIIKLKVKFKSITRSGRTEIGYLDLKGNIPQLVVRSGTSIPWNSVRLLWFWIHLRSKVRSIFSLPKKRKQICEVLGPHRNFFILESIQYISFFF
jgi:hypothetical protein